MYYDFNMSNTTVGAHDEVLKTALSKYYQEKLGNNAIISKRLQAEYGIQMRSPSHPITIFYCVLTILLVKRRRKELGLHGSKTTMKTIDLSEAEQLVVKAMDKDPAKRSGVRTIHQKIAFDEKIHLSRY